MQKWQWLRDLSTGSPSVSIRLNLLYSTDSRVSPACFSAVVGAKQESVKHRGLWLSQGEPQPWRPEGEEHGCTSEVSILSQKNRQGHDKKVKIPGPKNSGKISNLIIHV